MKAGQDLFAESDLLRGRKLAWFVAGAALIVISAAVYMSVQKDMFKRTTQLYCLADSAKGMVSGMAVKLNGFRIGTLSKLAMDTGGRVSIVLLVSEEYRHLIHKDAKARLSKEDLIGEGVIEVLPGSESSPTVENNAVIAFERARDVGDELSKLAIQLQPILADVKNITAYVDNPEGELKKALRELKRATAAIADTGEGVKEMTRQNQPQIRSAVASASNAMNTLDASLPKLIGSLDASLHHVEGVTSNAKAVSNDAIAISADVKTVSANAKTISNDIKTISGGLASDIPPAASAGRATVQDTQEIVNAVKESWPVSNLLPQRQDRPLPLDSHVPLDR